MSKSKMTSTEWISLINKLVELLHKHSELRYGQAIMNALNDVRPDLYKEITGTNNDPFYDDNKLVLFMRYLNDVSISK